MPYGLVDITMTGITPTAVFKINLPIPAPEEAKWYKCNSEGCIDFDREEISGGMEDGAVFNDNRTSVTVYITDNGDYDDDNRTGIIRDPSGLGMECMEDTDCDDGKYCNGSETCDEGACIAGNPPCSGSETCDEDNDKCTSSSSSSSGSSGSSSSSGGGGGTPTPTTTTSIVETTTTTSVKTGPETTTTTIVVPAPAETTTTTTDSGKKKRCPVEQVLGENSTSLNLLRAFRDKKLSTSNDGLLLISLYYAHAEEVTDILSENPDLADSVRRLIEEIMPAVKSAMETNNEIKLSESQHNSIVDLLTQFEDKASPELGRSIKYVLKKLETGQLFQGLW